jgi:alpha-tubulin suppressor-like RCC1 family protein
MRSPSSLKAMLLFIGSSAGCWLVPSRPGTSEVSPRVTTAQSTSTSSAAPDAPLSVIPANKTLALRGGTACAIVAGAVACWGDDTQGVISKEGGAVSQPRVIAGIRDAVAVAVGRSFGCALGSTGVVTCFHDGVATERLRGAVDLAILGETGDETLLAATREGKLVGLAFDRGHVKPPSPVKTPLLADTTAVTAVTAGQGHACALHTSGEVSCWGLPDLTGLRRPQGAPSDDERSKAFREAVKPDGLSGVVQLQAGPTHTCAVTQAKQVFCWGYNTSGSLGEGTWESFRQVPTQVPNVEGAQAVGVGPRATCARLSSGKLRCWGDLHTSEWLERSRPKPGGAEVAELSEVTAVAVGEEFACASLASGGVSCWGSASRGRLGNGVVADDATPRLVKSFPGATQIAAGATRSCVVEASGAVSCWGLGKPSEVAKGVRGFTPQPVAALRSIEKLALRRAAALAIDRTKKVLTFDGKPMRLGPVTALSGEVVGLALLETGDVVLWDRSIDERGAPKPQPVPSLADVVGVASLSNVGCVVHRDGSVSCLSFTPAGKAHELSAPFKIPGLRGASAIAAAGERFCVIAQGGTVSCFVPPRPSTLGGEDGPKPKGRGPKSDHPEIVLSGPSKVSNATRLALGEAFACALSSDGTVSCWGDNPRGQLGRPGYGYGQDAAPVPGLSDVIGIAAGDTHACALRKNGEVLCWGDNHFDQAGQSAASFAFAPTPVTLPRGEATR